MADTTDEERNTSDDEQNYKRPWPSVNNNNSLDVSRISEGCQEIKGQETEGQGSRTYQYGDDGPQGLVGEASLQGNGWSPRAGLESMPFQRRRLSVGLHGMEVAATREVSRRSVQWTELPPRDETGNHRNGDSNQNQPFWSSKKKEEKVEKESKESFQPPPLYYDKPPSSIASKSSKKSDKHSDSKVIVNNESILLVLSNILRELRRGKPLEKSGIEYPYTQTVEIRALFQRLFDVNTKEQHFGTELVLQARWQEKQFAGLSEKELSAIEFKQCWDPKFKLMNLIGGYLECERGTMVLRYEPEHVYPVLTYVWSIKGLFAETLELEHFPLDVQELSVVLSSERPASEMELVEDLDRISSMNPRVNQCQEWVAYHHVTMRRDVTTSQSLGTKTHPVLVISAHAKRNLSFYMWNIVFILFLIVCLSFVTVALEPTSPQRLTILITLFLTTVAFKLVLKDAIPKVTYLTYLDMYVVCILLLLATSASLNALLIHLAGMRTEEQIAWYHEIIHVFLICIVVVAHAIFIIYIMLTAMSKRRDMGKLDFEHQLGKSKKRRENDLDVRRQNRQKFQESPSLKGKDNQSTRRTDLSDHNVDVASVKY